MSQPSAFAAVRAASAFARRAWRRAGLVQFLAATGLALWVAGLHAPSSPQADQLAAVGLAVALVAWAPLWTGLMGAALGRRVPAGGLQFGAPEWRFVALLVSGLAALVLGLLVLIGVSAWSILLFNLVGPIGLPWLGPEPGGLVAAVLVWLFGLVALAWAGARLSFAPLLTLTRDRLVIEEAWAAGHSRTAATVLALSLVQGPMLLMLSLAALADSLAGQAPFAGSWSWPAALAGGALFGAVTAFVQAPLTAGVLGALSGAGKAPFAGETQTGATLQPA